VAYRNCHRNDFIYLSKNHKKRKLIKRNDLSFTKSSSRWTFADGEIWVYVLFFVVAVVYSYFKHDKNKRDTKQKK
jgi:hypothetical protein